MNKAKGRINGRSFVIILILLVICWCFWPIAIPFLNIFRDYSMPHVLKTMDIVTIHRHMPAAINGPPISVTGTTIATLDADHNSAMLDLLRKSSGFHVSPQQTDGDFTFIVLDFEEKHWTDYPGPAYRYCSKTGELGRDKEWCYVPAQFKTWMLKLGVATPPQRPMHITHGPRPYDPVVVNGR